MYKSIPIIFILAVALFAQDIPCFQIQEKLFYIPPGANEEIYFEDYDSDHREEFIHVVRSYDGIEPDYIQYFDERKDNNLWRLNIEGTYNGFSFIRIKDNTDFSLFFAIVFHDTLYLEVLNLVGEVKRKIPLFKVMKSKGENIWDCRADMIGVSDVNDDGIADYILKVGGGFDGAQRGIYCYDGDSGEMFWEFQCGTVPDKVFLLPENMAPAFLVMSTAAPNNGFSKNETDDSHSYIITLDRYGKLLWKKEIGGPGSNIELDTLSVPDKKHLCFVASLAGVRSTHEPEYPILVGNPATGEIFCKRHFPYQGRNLKICDLDGDGKNDIIIVFNTDSLKVFSTDLNDKVEYSIGGIRALLDVFDGNGNGKPELFVISNQGQLLALDHNLQPIAYFKDAYKPHIFRCGFTSSHLLAFSSIDEVILVSWPKPKPISWLGFSISLTGWIAIIFAGLLLVLLILLYLFSKEKSTLNNVLANFGIGFIITDYRHKIKYINLQAEQLFRETKPASKDSIQESIKRENILPDWLISQFSKIANGNEKALQEFPMESRAGERFTLSVLRKRIPAKGNRNDWLYVLEERSGLILSRRTARWIEMAQSLAHKIKNPLNIMRLTVQKLEREQMQSGISSSEFSEGLGSIREEIERLQDATRSFLTFARLGEPNMKYTDMNELLTNISERYLPILPKKVALEFYLTANFNTILVDPEQMDTVVTHLLDNSITAVGSKGNVTLKLAKEEEVKPSSSQQLITWMVMEIEDDGIGMPEEQLKEAVKPFKTYTDSGSGLGLSVVNWIVENHGGRFKIESKSGVGTVARVHIPLA